MSNANGGFNLREWLQKPILVLTVVGGIAAAAVVLDGTLFRIWSLNRDHGRINGRISKLKSSVKEKEARLLEANRPEFIERAAREQFDFVRDGDLVFVFADEPKPE